MGPHRYWDMLHDRDHPALGKRGCRGLNNNIASLEIDLRGELISNAPRGLSQGRRAVLKLRKAANC
jgi:hypothetical protein